MKRIAMICPPATGHIFPSLALATSLRERGHEIVFFQVANIGKSRERIEQAGFPCRIYGTEELQAYLARSYQTLGEQNGLTALRTMIEIVRKRVSDTIFQLPEVFNEEQVDCALIDRLMPGAAAVATGLRLPFASVSNALVLNRDSAVPPCFTTWKPDHRWNRLRNTLAYTFYSSATKSILRAVNQYRSQCGLPVVKSLDDNVRDALQVSQQPEFFTFPRDTPIPHMHFCGPFVNSATRKTIEFPWERLTGKPLVYMSLGTLQNRTTNIFRIVAEACSTLDVDLVISTGGASHEFHPKLPGNPVVTRFAPQLELLQKASLFVTHAGLNSALESLSAGVPMVAIPVANDQPGVAARLNYHGFGKLLTPKKMTVGDARAAIQDAINNKTIQANLARARTRLQNIDGCRTAVDLIEEFVLRVSKNPFGATRNSPALGPRFAAVGTTE